MLLLLQQNLLLGDVQLVEVPDVVGETEAAGTATLEGEGFVVSVSTAYSSTVAAGLIISQDPAGGVEYPQGGTVAIVVSLGEAPAPEQTGGGHYWPTKRKKRTDPLEERIREQREEEQQLRAQIEQALRPAPTVAKAPAIAAEAPQAEPEPQRVAQLESLSRQLARTERRIERYTEVERRRDQRADKMAASIEAQAEALLEQIEEELTREAERLRKVLH